MFVAELKFTEDPVHPSGWQRVYHICDLKARQGQQNKGFEASPHMVLSFYFPKGKGMEGKQQLRWNIALKSFLHRQSKEGKSYKLADVVGVFSSF